MIVGVHSPHRIRLSASWGLGWGGPLLCPSPSSSAPYGPHRTAAKTQTPPGCGGRSASRCWRFFPAGWKSSVRNTAVHTVFLTSDIMSGRIVLVLFFKNKPTLLLLCCVALLTSTAKVTQSLSSSFSRTNRSGSCERRIRRRLAIFRSMSVEDTRGFLRRKRFQVNSVVCVTFKFGCSKGQWSHLSRSPENFSTPTSLGTGGREGGWGCPADVVSAGLHWEDGGERRGLVALLVPSTGWKELPIFISTNGPLSSERAVIRNKLWLPMTKFSQ